ncbi:4Fe-4S dicluster domain-containing protein [Streptomyces sp. AN091965]|uniref:4Fe-4S dicluster domain-containing protein n=1 Tax=Streptomyces sp. AN091965 TaxID=2927803 RepID=UPI001F6247E2|nr:4Fe-4S dicluster domain-containing protein [Streptomyces sp. AN091965]MCI3928851.1 4Fe-4S dicluster domain-containing protein [Streptomyces sp. AN091965]
MAATGTTAVIDRNGLAALVATLVAEGRTVVGPTVRDGAIGLDVLESADELPFGWGVELDAGRYRLTPREDGAAFAHCAGPQSWKAYLHPQREQLWSARRGQDGVPVFTEHRPEAPSYAFVGVRPCDLRALAIQDRVLAGGRHPDRGYQQRRRGALLIAAECTEPGATCFCVSTGGGPAADTGFDLALTEVVDEDGHRFFVRVGSEHGARLLAAIPHREADLTTESMARGAVDAARDRMGRTLPPVDLKALIGASTDADHWDDVASRCLTCANCTMVCPTCFCTTTEEVTDLTGDHTERWQRWDSCFDLDFSRLHSGPVRASARSRYRQWLTHKLSTWHDQFDTGGCVGCGRCVAWCPVGIDITEEVAALAAERDAKATADARTAQGVGEEAP